MESRETAFQDQMPHNLCWGCGPANPQGLCIKSFWDGDESVCSYTPQPHQMAGPTHIVNGGILASLIDCHCVCTAIAAAYRAEGRSIGSEPRIWFATGSLRIEYLRPTPLGAPVHLRARVLDQSPKKMRLQCSIFTTGETPAAECARGEVVAVRVPTEWFEAGPPSI